MKNVFIILIIIIPTVLYAQNNSPYRSLKLDNNQVIYQQTFGCDSVYSENIKKMLSTFVPTIRNLKDYHLEGDVITGTLSGSYVDYKKYGAKWGNTAAFLNHPFSANVNFQWKDGKYRATATSIVFHTAGLGDMDATNLFSKGRQAKDWNSNAIIIRAGEYLEQYLTDLFTAKQTENW